MGGAQRQPPCGHRPAHAFGDAVMAGKDGLQPLIQQHLGRDLQPVDQPDRRGIGEPVGGIALGHVADVEESARQARPLNRRHGFGRKPDDGQPGRQHEALLRPGHRHIDAPFVHPEIIAGDRADPVDQQQRRMARPVQRAADGGDVGPNAGRGLVMGGQDGLDPMGGVGGQDLLEPVGGDALAPGLIHDLHIQPVPLAHVDPAVAEHPVPGGQHRGARRQGVGDRRLPPAGAGRGKDKDLRLRRFQDLFHALQRGMQDLAEHRAAMVDGGHVDGLAKHLGDVRRAGNEDRVLGAHSRLLLDATRCSTGGGTGKFF
ncbi:hypothetical protein PANO111632_12925 [Paracoccus nototheniae]